MKSQFRQVALIGKFQAVSSGATGPSSRLALERIADFLMAQGCEVVVEADTAANMGLNRRPVKGYKIPAARGTPSAL